MAKKDALKLVTRDEEQMPSTPKHPNTVEEQQEITTITKRVNEMYGVQVAQRPEFNDRTLQQYIDDNEQRINTYVPPRGEDIDDWQTKGFEGITREQMLAFVSKVAMKRPEYAFRATRKDGMIDRVMGDIMSDFYDYTWAVEDPTQVKFLQEAWMIAGHGTGIRYEGVSQTLEEVETFEEYDVTTGELKGRKLEKQLSDLNCVSRMVRLTDFLIPDVYQPDIQKQPYIAEQVVMNRYEFDTMYGEYYNASEVPHQKEIEELYGETYLMQHAQSANPELDQVLVTFYYEKSGGRTKFRIIANGVMILATPFPRKDGKYPYAKGIFELMADTNFFYGMAMPHKLESDEDIYNALKNMVVDRSILHVQRPIIAEKGNDLQDQILAPNRILSLKGNVQELNIAPPSQADMTILEYLRDSANRQGIDDQQRGQVTGGATAREIVIADENARRLMGVARRLLESFDLDAARLRMGNILQFYFEPTKVEEVLTENQQKDLKAVYRTITLENRRLSDRKRGVKSISIVGKREDLPSRRELDIQEEMARQQGFELERGFVNANYVKNINVDVLPMPKSSFLENRSLDLALELEYQQTVAALYPRKFMQHHDQFFQDLNEVYDKDMNRFKEGEQAGVSPEQAMAALAPATGQAQPQASEGPPVSAQLTNAGNQLGELVGR